LATIILSLLKVSMIIILFLLLPVILVSCLYPLYLFKKLQRTNEL
jgi:hypothetical protein